METSLAVGRRFRSGFVQQNFGGHNSARGAYLQERERVLVVECEHLQFVRDRVEPQVLAVGILGDFEIGAGPDQRRALPIGVWDDRRFVNLVWLEASKLEDLIFFADRLANRIARVREQIEATQEP